MTLNFNQSIFLTYHRVYTRHFDSLNDDVGVKYSNNPEKKKLCRFSGIFGKFTNITNIECTMMLQIKYLITPNVSKKI